MTKNHFLEWKQDRSKIDETTIAGEKDSNKCMK